MTNRLFVLVCLAVLMVSASITSLSGCPAGSRLDSGLSANDSEGGKSPVVSSGKSSGGQAADNGNSVQTSSVAAVATSEDLGVKADWSKGASIESVIPFEQLIKDYSKTNENEDGYFTVYPSPDCAFLCVNRYYSQYVYEISMKTSQILAMFDCGFPVNRIAFSPDSKLMAAAAGEEASGNNNEIGHGRLSTWNLNGAKLASRLDISNKDPEAVCFTPDGSSIVVGYRSVDYKSELVEMRSLPNLEVLWIASLKANIMGYVSVTKDSSSG